MPVTGREESDERISPETSYSVKGMERIALLKSELEKFKCFAARLMPAPQPAAC
jgi:uncharacterized small protein (DUF1192 family)